MLPVNTHISISAVILLLAVVTTYALTALEAPSMRDYDTSDLSAISSSIMDKRFREPIRFGKRAREPIRFGKREREPIRFGKRTREAFRLGKPDETWMTHYGFIERPEVWQAM
ncbi:hypothetical protein AB6A40_000556 [Gnathostoma spinigerum]|uniref:Uncharacterized protein n=1 Tax=Gnathostoma spinigerum TaxID=75299 RepID=A0ABD6EAY6_9BILA